MNVPKGISDSIALVGQLVADIEAGGSLGKDVAVIAQDPKVMASLMALIADLVS